MNIIYIIKPIIHNYQLKSFLFSKKLKGTLGVTLTICRQPVELDAFYL